MMSRTRSPLTISLCCAAAVLLFAGCSSTSTFKSSSPTKQRLLDVASGLLGTPYCRAGATAKCFDCSGFVNYCFYQIGVELPRRAIDIYGRGLPAGITNLVEGDLVFFRTDGKDISHVGIMVDSKRFIHSATSSGVMISPLTDAYWSPRYVGAKRLLE